MTELDALGLLHRLTAAGVRFVVVGGFAVIAHGVIRATADLDICPDPEPANLRRLSEVLASLGAEQLGVGDFDPDELPLDPRNPEHLAQGGNFRTTTSLGGLDVMQWLLGLPDEEAFAALAEQAVEADVEGTVVRVASLAHVRAMKRAAGRPQDEEDLRRLALAHPEG